MTNVQLAVLLLIAMALGGAICLVPVKFVIGPELRKLTDDAKFDAQRARSMAATTHQGLMAVEKRVNTVEDQVAEIAKRCEECQS